MLADDPFAGERARHGLAANGAFAQPFLAATANPLFRAAMPDQLADKIQRTPSPREISEVGGGFRPASARQEGLSSRTGFIADGSPNVATPLTAAAAENPLCGLCSRRNWRPEPESNRRAGICSPLRNHSAIGPLGVARHWRERGRRVKADFRRTVCLNAWRPSRGTINTCRSGCLMRT